MFFRIHKEGQSLIALAGLSLLVVNFLLWITAPLLFWPVAVLSLILFGLILQFFRNPSRPIPSLDNHLAYAPADGRICAIEEVFEPEFFKEKRLLVSIFMSPFNVHVNRNPVGGTVIYFRYHAGK